MDKSSDNTECPLEWYQDKLLHYIKKYQPDRLPFNPKVTGQTETHIYFGMYKHYGRLVLPKSELIKIHKERMKEHYARLYQQQQIVLEDTSKETTITKRQLEIIGHHYRIGLYILAYEGRQTLDEILSDYEKENLFEPCKGFKQAIHFSKWKSIDAIKAEIERLKSI